MQQKFRDDFNGSSLNPDEWDIIQQGSGHTITVTAGELRIATGTTPNTETIIRSKRLFTIPFRVMIPAYLSQRIANQEFYLEIIAEDDKDRASWKFDSANAQYAKICYQNGDGALQTSGDNGLSTATSGYAIYEIEAFVDEVFWHQRYCDSTSGRSQSIVRHRDIPDPNKRYYVQIRAKNLSTAPASSTTLYLASVAVQDYAELTAEITAGRGNIVPGQGVGAYITGGGLTGYCYDRLAWYADTTTPLGANASFTGTTRDTGSTGQYNKFRVSVYADQPGTLYIDVSRDGSTWRQAASIAVGAGEYKELEIKVFRRYVRARYVNGSTAQSAFELCSALVGIGAS
ncbi:MAG: hypothetical protein ACPLPR_02220 [Bacillota bacterium]